MTYLRMHSLKGVNKMNRKGFTLAELVLSIGILGLVSMSLLSMLTAGYSMLFRSRKFAEDTYTVQQTIEQQMEDARVTAPDGVIGENHTFAINLWGKDIEGSWIQSDIASEGITHGEIHVFVPQYKVEYTVPEIDSVSIVAERSGTTISEPFFYPLNQDVTFTGTKVDGDQSNFLLNVYRWYMSPISATPSSDYRDWIIVKEWNEARTPLSFADAYDEDLEEFTAIPNIEANYNVLDLNADFGFSDEQIALNYAGRSFVYSVTPYSDIGRIGEEIFSNAISTNRILSIPDITVQVEWDGTESLDLRDDYSQVDANMLNSAIVPVNATWATPEVELWDPNDPANAGRTEDVHNGSVVGFPDGVKLHLIMVDEIVTLPVGSVSITGDSRLVIPTSSSLDFYYSAQILDSNGQPMTDAVVVWNVTGIDSGTTISNVSGNTLRIRVSSSAISGNFNISATYESESASLDVGVVKTYYSGLNYSTVSTTNNTNTRTTTYTINIKGNDGLAIATIPYEAFLIQLGGDERTLEEWDDYQIWSNNRLRDVYNITFNSQNNGTYVITMKNNRSSSNQYDYSGEVTIEYQSAPDVTIGTNLRVQYYDN